MKILYIASGDAKYGASKALIPVITELKLKHDVTPIIITKSRNELNDFCDCNNIENYSCWYCDIMAGASYSSRFLRIVKHIVKYILFIIGCITKYFCKPPINWNEIDLIHTNHNRIGIGSYWARKYRIPYIWHIREFGKEDYNLVFYKSNCIEFMNKTCKNFIAISNAVKNTWVNKGLREENITVIYDSVPPKEEYAVTYPRCNSEEIKLVMVGHVQESKGQHILIEALSYLSDDMRKKITVDFIGEVYSDYYLKLTKLIHKFHLERQISFLGYVENVQEKLRDYNIGINASKSEAFGLITVEYMFAGLYVIASNTGANKEIITDNMTGFIYEYNNPVDLAQKIEYVIKKGLSDNTIALEAYKEANKRFSPKVEAEILLNFYNDILKKERVGNYT